MNVLDLEKLFSGNFVEQLHRIKDMKRRIASLLRKYKLFLDSQFSIFYICIYLCEVFQHIKNVFHSHTETLDVSQFTNSKSLFSIHSTSFGKRSSKI